MVPGEDAALIPPQTLPAPTHWPHAFSHVIVYVGGMRLPRVLEGSEDISTD
jgi:hypothetical protein